MEVNPTKIAKVLVALIIMMGVLVAVDTAVSVVDPSTLPGGLVPYWNYLVIFFETAPIAFIVGFGRNILGYARKYFKSNYKENYDVNKLYETWAYYTGALTTVLACVPAPYNGVAAAVVIIFDFITSEIRKL